MGTKTLHDDRDELVLQQDKNQEDFAEILR